MPARKRLSGHRIRVCSEHLVERLQGVYEAFGDEELLFFATVEDGFRRVFVGLGDVWQCFFCAIEFGECAVNELMLFLGVTGTGDE